MAVLCVGACTAACDRDRTPTGGARRSGPPPTASAPRGGPLASAASASLPASPSQPPPAAATAADLPRPLPSAGELIALPVEGFAEQVATVPSEPAPSYRLVVALHGNYDRPEWQCETWLPILGKRAFVLCPRGIARGDAPRGADRWTFAGKQELEREIEAGVAALVSRFGRALRASDRVLLGFSLGAILGVPLALESAGVYRTLIAIEGGWESWSARRVSAFVAAGGHRALFACGQTACRGAVRRLEPSVRAQGLDLRHGFVPAGHRYDGPVAAIVRDNLAWLEAGSVGEARGLADGGETEAPALH